VLRSQQLIRRKDVPQFNAVSFPSNYFVVRILDLQCRRRITGTYTAIRDTDSTPVFKSLLYITLTDFVITWRLRKITKSDYHLRHACLSVRKELGSRMMDFHKILYINISRKFVQKIQVSLKTETNNGYFT